MLHALLLYFDPALAPAEDSPEGQAEFQQWMQYSEALGATGLLKGGEALQPHETSTTVRVREGETLLTDGPFAETKEVLGGFFILDAPDLDAAIEWAAKAPHAGYGSIELRPVVSFE